MAEGQASGRFALALPRYESSIEQMRAALIAYFEPFALEAKLVNRLEVVLEELVSNVVRHATEAKSVIVTAERSGDAVVLTVEDDGPPFNPLDMAERERFSELDDAPLGGLGIPLIRRLSRAVRYDRIDRLNRITAEIAAD